MRPLILKACAVSVNGESLDPTMFEYDAGGEFKEIAGKGTESEATSLAVATLKSMCRVAGTGR